LTADIKICKTHKNNLPQINADQRRNNLRNSATSAGNKNRPPTDPSQSIFRLGWCGNHKPSQPTEFIASDAAVVVIRLLFIVF
jgi:hypothetical protein